MWERVTRTRYPKTSNGEEKTHIQGKGIQLHKSTDVWLTPAYKY